MTCMVPMDPRPESTEAVDGDCLIRNLFGFAVDVMYTAWPFDFKFVFSAPPIASYSGSVSWVETTTSGCAASVADVNDILSVWYWRVLWM